MRLRPGDDVTVADGRGRWRVCRFGSVLEPAGPVVQDPPAEPRLTVAFALTKGERPEWTVQKLTELGVDEIVPFLARRSVVKWDDERQARNTERLRRVAREASMQSRRSWLPDVSDAVSFGDVAARAGAVLLDGDGPRAPSLDHRVLLIGPEGGWDETERAAGLPVVRLGPRVLRAETAAVAAGALWCGLRAGIVASEREL